MTEPAIQSSDPPRRTTTGAIPLHWAMPAELSVNAAGLATSTEKRTVPPTRRRATPASLAAVVVVSVVLGLFVGAYSSDIEAALAPVFGASTTTDGSSADTAAIATATTGSQAAVEADAPMPAAVAAPAELAAGLDVLVDEPAPAPPVEAAQGPDAEVESAVVVPATDGAPPSVPDAVVVVAASEPDPSTERAASTATLKEPTSEEVVPLKELPVRKKVRQMVTRAEGHIKAGRFDDAVLVLQRAEIVDGSYPLLHRTRGIAEASRGQTDAARQAYRRYLRLAPNAPDAADVRRILGE